MGTTLISCTNANGEQQKIETVQITKDTVTIDKPTLTDSIKETTNSKSQKIVKNKKADKRSAYRSCRR